MSLYRQLLKLSEETRKSILQDLKILTKDKLTVPENVYDLDELYRVLGHVQSKLDLIRRIKDKAARETSSFVSLNSKELRELRDTYIRQVDTVTKMIKAVQYKNCLSA